MHFSYICLIIDMSSLILSTIGYTLTVINSFIFLVCVIIFLSVYKRRGDKFTNKEKLNYNLCAAYIIYGITSLAPGANYYWLRYIYYFEYYGVLLVIYNLYAYMFSLSLKSNEHKINLWVLIYFWSFALIVPLLFVTLLYKLLIFYLLIIIPIIIACIYIPIQIIRCWCKITKAYKKIDCQDEEEKKVRDKNYNHLICFAAIQIITFLLIIGLVIMPGITRNPNISFISSIINSVTHYFFLFYFVYDDDSIKAFKQIIKCKRESTVRQEDLLISNVLVKGEE